MEVRLDQKYHRWLSTQQICNVLRNPNYTISAENAVKPPSGSIVLYDKKLLRRFRNDGYTWKKAKNGRTKEGHEKLKLGGAYALHCYYAHREDDGNFHRRCFSMFDQNLSTRVLVHYRDVKEDQIRTGKGVLPSSKIDVSAYDHQASSGLPPVSGLQHDCACFSSNPSNFQHSQATDATNLNSAQTLEPENTVLAYNYRASYELPPIPGSQHEIASSIPNPVNVAAYNHQASSGLPPILGLRPSNFQHSQATDAINVQDFKDFGDPSNCESFGNLPFGLTGLGNCGSFGNFPCGLPDAACTNSRVSSSAAVEPSHSSLGKRQCDSTKSKATPFATIEGVDEDEEGNDTNQGWKRLKVTCGQKSPVPQPTATIGIATSAATNMTAAPESSNPAMLQSRPTSDDNQDFVQDVENQEQELEPTSIELENGKSKAVVQNDFGTGKSHEFSEVAVKGSCKNPHALFDPASAPNTLAGSSISTPTRDWQDMATIGAILEMDFTTMAGDVQRTDKSSLIRSFVDSERSDSGIRTKFLSILNLLEQPLRDYSEYDKGKNLNDQVEATIKRLELKLQFWDSKTRELQELEKLKMPIEADLAALRAETDGATKETKTIVAELMELFRQRGQFKENEGRLKASSSISTPTRDWQDMATIGTILEMDFTTMAGDVQRTEKSSLIRSFIDSERSDSGIRTNFLSISNLLEQPLRDYSEYDKGKNLNDQVEATIKRLELQLQFSDSKTRELQELEKLKMQIEANQAAIRAETDGAIKETKTILAELMELFRQRGQFKENEGKLKASLDIGHDIWRSTKKVIQFCNSKERISRACQMENEY